MKNTHISRSLDLDAFNAQISAVSAQAHAKLERDRTAARMRNLEKIVQRSAIPENFKNADLNPLDDRQVLPFNEALRFLRSNCFALVIYGDSGRGKTHVACALANRELSAGKSIVFVTAYEYCLLIDKSRRRDALIDEYSVLGEFSQPELLILDDLGRESNHEYKRTILTSLIDARYRRRSKIILTSNLNLDEIANITGERGFDRLAGSGSIFIEMRGKSLR